MATLHLRRVAVAVAMLAAGTGCESERPAPAAGEPNLPEFVRFSGLTLPADATGILLSKSQNKDGQLMYRGKFNTTRSGAVGFCREEQNFSDQESLPQPDARAIVTFGITENSVGGSMTCRGSNPANSNINREAVAVYPAKDRAVVYVRAYERTES
jgi:hypothetical protein